MLKTSEIEKDFKAKYIDIAREKLKYEDLSDQEKRNYERHVMDIVRERDIMETAKDEGREEGREEGIKEGVILTRREDILENLGEIATVTDEIIKMVNEESDIEVLKKWVKISSKVESLRDFIDDIRF